MDVTIFFAMGLGIVFGILIGRTASKFIITKLGKSSAAPRVVFICAVASAFIFLLPALFFSFVVGGNLGGGWGEAASTALGLGSVGVPVGLTLGIAIFLGGGLLLGAFVGCLFGKVLINVFPKLARP